MTGFEAAGTITRASGVGLEPLPLVALVLNQFASGNVSGSNARDYTCETPLTLRSGFQSQFSELRELELRLEAEQSGVNDARSECTRRKTALDERESRLDDREMVLNQAEHDAG